MFIEENLKNIVETLFQNKQKTIDDALGIEYEYISKQKMVAKMPVTDNTKQPFGLLHGGASVVLAESLCSFGAWLNVNPDTSAAVGMEINANHIRAVKTGCVTGIAKPLHKGATSQVWGFEIYTESGKLVCTGRCTMAVIQKKLT